MSELYECALALWSGGNDSGDGYPLGEEGDTLEGAVLDEWGPSAIHIAGPHGGLWALSAAGEVYIAGDSGGAWAVTVPDMDMTGGLEAAILRAAEEL